MASPFPIFLLLSALWASPSICSSRKVELKTKEAKSNISLNLNTSRLTFGFDPSKAKQLSWHPRVFLYEGFLSDEECDHLVSLAHDKLEKSLVRDNVTSSSSIHTGTRAIVTIVRDDIISEIEERISLWTFLPRENGEDMQILHYGVNESYEPHFDYYRDNSEVVSGENRIATILLYLSDVSHGGETVFPNSEVKNTQQKDGTWSECAVTGYAVNIVKGNALLIFNLNLDATPDERSLHGSCKVLDGEKWIATKYIHVGAFSTTDATKSLAVSSDVECTDEDDNCPRWAAIGECQRNPVFMAGTPDYYGACRKSCHIC
uniref:procollagen-proline 4-dioxygenase n=1 Tax=Ananas comosus var. bracteatus TaxID=296719 RepID=A0A6V7QIS5_ANACO|nr:unnamed protein product [Ananas comosus var. bracteatus]